MIRRTKLRGVYEGRKAESTEDNLVFMSKQKKKKAIEYLTKGNQAKEAANLT